MGAFDPLERGIHQLETFLFEQLSDPEMPRKVHHRVGRSRGDSAVRTTKGFEAVYFDSGVPLW